MPAFSSAEIDQALKTIPDWRLDKGALARGFSFSDFGKAISFVNSVAAVAERAGHHPDIDIRYNKVRLALTTHDAGGITAKDFDLAAKAGLLV